MKPNTAVNNEFTGYFRKSPELKNSKQQSLDVAEKEELDKSRDNATSTKEEAKIDGKICDEHTKDQNSVSTPTPAPTLEQKRQDLLRSLKSRHLQSFHQIKKGARVD